jgi:hypothetical protein
LIQRTIMQIPLPRRLPILNFMDSFETFSAIKLHSKK